MPSDPLAKVLLITGASRGIGAVTARLAAARGYAVARGQPGPPAAEPGQAGFLELFFEFVEAPKGRVDGPGQVAGRGRGSAGRHQLPEHGVVVVTAAVIANGRTNRLGHLSQIPDQLLNREFVEVRMILERRIQVVDVGIVVLVVVDPHRLLIDGRFQGVVGVWQWRQGMRHRMAPTGEY